MRHPPDKGRTGDWYYTTIPLTFWKFYFSVLENLNIVKKY